MENGLLQRMRRSRESYLLMLPYLLVFTVFTLVPVIVAIVLFGNRSLITLYWLAAQAECPAAASPISTAGHQGVLNHAPIGCASRENNGNRAKMNIDFILAAYGCMPFFSTKYFGT